MIKRLIRKAERYTMYHGTSYENAKKILSDGFIKPRNETGATSDLTYTLQNDVIYLSENVGYASSYINSNEQVAFEVIIDDKLDKLRADEDSVRPKDFFPKFEQACQEKGVEVPEDVIEYWDSYGVYEKIQKQSDPIYLQIANEILNELAIEDSLQYGSIAFVGSIPVNRISRMYVGIKGESTTITLDELNRLAKEEGWE